MSTTLTPWEAFGRVVRGCGRFICSVRHKDIPEDEGSLRSEEADARLIAASPDLLRACKDLLQCLEYVYRAHPATTGSLKAAHDIAAARAAIQKAEGPQ